MRVRLLRCKHEDPEDGYNALGGSMCLERVNGQGYHRTEIMLTPESTKRVIVLSYSVGIEGKDTSTLRRRRI